ncbi:phospholipase D family protein [Mesorhizobium sp. M7A.F.Ca.US.011.01.1.1]|uniref:phospholipase D family protein n=1 Tax=Mesorhizobium sp. M7A.F.Ca.US.011.01.1.1 TaxID=2496741 RepID=UPI0013E2FDBA|nr:phospholipase D family protein [Mesorhizobium sp. M7A.F.Ca.US.011.01.1.1]
MPAVSKMTTRFVDKGWSQEISQALHTEADELRIISPFIKVGAVHRLLIARPKVLKAITRFNLADFAEGVSDIAALRGLLASGGAVRGVRNLHAKMYLFGSKRAIVTSANLTEAALNRNHEFGLVSDDKEIIAACRRYFDDLWRRGGTDLMVPQLDLWDQIVTRCRLEGGRRNSFAGLGDFGADAGVTVPPLKSSPVSVSDAPQAFVKFFGQGSNRAPLSLLTIDEVERAGCHWGLSYPASKRPSGVRDGAVIFISRLTSDPNDIRVFGRAIGLRHVPGRDDATPEDIQLRPFKQNWPRYVRVSNAEFVAGTMANGVSMSELMTTLGSDSFIPTQRNARQGEGNTDPRRAYMQQAAVELSNEGRGWLAERLQSAFDLHGKLPQDALDQLDWPQIP